MLTQITIEDENELAVREVFPKRANPSTMTTNVPRKASLPFAVFFFTGQTEER